MKLTTEEKTKRSEQRRQARKESKKLKEIEEEKNQRPIKEITINIEWKKSKTWDMNPHVEAEILYKENFFDGTNFERKFASCSGCGYDKESAVIADIFNQCLKYKLHNVKSNVRITKIPYGIRIGDFKHFKGGIGTDCYYKISEFIGGKFEKIASGKTFDVYKYTDLS